jgi:hypothetical protein
MVRLQAVRLSRSTHHDAAPSLGFDGHRQQHAAAKPSASHCGIAANPPTRASAERTASEQPTAEQLSYGTAWLLLTKIAALRGYDGAPRAERSQRGRQHHTLQSAGGGETLSAAWLVR